MDPEAAPILPFVTSDTTAAALLTAAGSHLCVTPPFDAAEASNIKGYSGLIEAS